MATYTPRNLYEESFRMNFNWEKHLYHRVYRFHDLMHLELSTLIELQMGIVLPFIAVCCGPETKAIFFTQPSVLNIFWMRIRSFGGFSRCFLFEGTFSLFSFDDTRYCFVHTDLIQFDLLWCYIDWNVYTSNWHQQCVIIVIFIRWVL